MFQRPQWEDIPLGRRIINRLAGQRAKLVPGIVPELVNWLRVIGNRYVGALESLAARSHTRGDSYINSFRQTTEFRIHLIQDLINLTTDQFALRDWLSAWSDTCRELDIREDDCDPKYYVPVELFQDGEGI